MPAMILRFIARLCALALVGRQFVPGFSSLRGHLRSRLLVNYWLANRSMQSRVLCPVGKCAPFSSVGQARKPHRARASATITRWYGQIRSQEDISSRDGQLKSPVVSRRWPSLPVYLCLCRFALLAACARAPITLGGRNKCPTQTLALSSILPPRHFRPLLSKQAPNWTHTHTHDGQEVCRVRSHPSASGPES